MDTAKRKVTVKLTYADNESSSSSTRPPTRLTTTARTSRPISPLKVPAGSQPSLSPSTRPRAKVNSSANVLSRKASSITSNGTSKSSNLSTHSFGSLGRASASNTPRAASPSKPPSRNPPLIQAVKSRPTVRAMLTPHTAQSLPSTPATRHRPGYSDSGLTTPMNDAPSTRRQSISSRQSMSFTSATSSPVTSDLNYTDHTSSSQVSAAPKIKAKVSGVAKYAESAAPSPALLSQRLTNTRPREPNVSSTYTSPVSSPPPEFPPMFYPITTSTAAANPHRYARPNPPANAYHYQPFAPQQENANVTHRRRPSFGYANGKVDPSNVPLPPHSPPASAVSFSSRSSVSRSSASYTAESQSSGPTHTNVSSGKHSPHYGIPLPREDSNSGDSGADRDTDGELNEAEREIKLEAKSIRKIQDLEISNRSLLAINVSLETTKNRQAKEIRELRRKLRESRLILPPRTFRAVKSSLDHDDTAEDDDEEEEEDEEQESPEEVEGPDSSPKDSDTHPHDQTYKRIKRMMEGLLEAGKRALEEPMVDFLNGPSSTAKVLTADEVRDWRHSSEGMEGDESIRLDGNDTDDQEHEQPSIGNITFDSEEEVEAITLSRISASPSPPPIRIIAS